MNIVQKSALIFTLVGALNWGMIGLFSFDLVAFLFGEMTMMSRIIYTLVGICGVVNLILLFVDLDEPTVDMPRKRA